MLTIIFAEFLIIGGLIWYIKKRNDQDAYLIAKKVNTGLELKRTMAMGLAYRFNFPRKKNEQGEVVFEHSTNIFLKQMPLEFESFVADFMEKRFGGNTLTTVKSGDFGVDFEHEREGELYLGQVKVKRDDLDFSPIALIHSNMVKRGAKGGYVITTSDFTSSAEHYAKDLNIELINGIQLVTYWLESMESQIYETTEEFA